MQTIVLTDSFSITDTGLLVTGQPTVQEWTHACYAAYALKQHIQFAIGDLLLYGEKHYGETYAQAMDETRLDYSTLSGYRWVANKVEICRRRQNLSFSHHEAVAALGPNEQDEVLSMAEAQRWNRDEVRAEVRTRRNPEPEPEPEWEPCPHCHGTGHIVRQKA